MSNKIESLNSRKEGLKDPSNALKESFRKDEKALDVITNGTALVPNKFSYINIVSSDANGNPTQVDYYNDDVTETSEITFSSDSAGSLASKYFVFYTGRDRIKYYVWYKVSSVGTDPAVADATGIQVNILNNDSAIVVAAATQLAIDSAASFYFRVTSYKDSITIYNKQGGTTSATADGDTGFDFETIQDGVESLVASLDITYDASGCVQTVKRY